MPKEILYIIIIILLICICIWAGYTAYTYYRRYNLSQASLSIYIDEYGRLRSGFEEARQLISNLGTRNKLIATKASEALEYLSRKY